MTDSLKISLVVLLLAGCDVPRDTFMSRADKDYYAKCRAAGGQVVYDRSIVNRTYCLKEVLPPLRD